MNQIGDPLRFQQAPELEREALAKAVVDARQNAEVIAKAAGARLGNARTINANTEFTQPPVPMVRAMAMEAKAAGGSAVPERRDDVQRNRQRAIRSDTPMNPKQPLVRAGALAVLWLTAGVAQAIETPKPQAAPEGEEGSAAARN